MSTNQVVSTELTPTLSSGPFMETMQTLLLQQMEVQKHIFQAVLLQFSNDPVTVARVFATLEETATVTEIKKLYGVTQELLEKAALLAEMDDAHRSYPTIH